MSDLLGPSDREALNRLRDAGVPVEVSVPGIGSVRFPADAVKVEARIRLEVAANREAASAPPLSDETRARLRELLDTTDQRGG